VTGIEVNSEFPQASIIEPNMLIGPTDNKCCKVIIFVDNDASSKLCSVRCSLMIIIG